VLAIIGLVIVFASVIGGFLMAKGQLAVLVQPSEFVVIGGAAIGSMLISTPPKILKEMLRQLAGIMKSGKSRKDYLDLMVMGYELLMFVRRDGLITIESHLQNPKESALFGKYNSFTTDATAVTFLTDTLELLTSGGSLSHHDLDELLEMDIEARNEEGTKPSRSLATIGDALPGLGIVAAVLGVVITMGHIDGPPAEIGHHVGAALVGTFLGILLSYGMVQPLSSNIAAKVEDYKNYLLVLRSLLVSLQKNTHPTVAVELARRSLPSDLRPTSAELTEACRAVKNAAAT